MKFAFTYPIFMNFIQLKVLGALSRTGLSELFFYGRKRRKYLSADYLLSERYKDFVKTDAGATPDFETFLDDAEKATSNYRFRHHPHIQKQLGSWRWKGMYQYREQLVPILFKKGAKGIDLGGAFGPVSKEATIVDFASRDIFGRPVRYKYLDEVDFRADYIFASHTFEHIRELDNLAEQMKRVLKAGGDLVILVPAYSCVSWRVGNHVNLLHNDHVWTFHLAGTKIEEPINNLLAIDTWLEKHFQVYLKTYTGDNSILLLAKNLR